MEQIVFIVFTIKLVFVAKIKCEWDSGKDECTVAVKTIQNHIKRHLQFCKKARPHVATPPIGYNLYYNSSCVKPVCGVHFGFACHGLYVVRTNPSEANGFF